MRSSIATVCGPCGASLFLVSGALVRPGAVSRGPCGGRIEIGDEYVESPDCAGVGNPWQHDRLCAECLGDTPTVSRRVRYHICEACKVEVPESHLAVGHPISTHHRSEPVISETTRRIRENQKNGTGFVTAVMVSR